MWILRHSPVSPFVRKVRIAADVCGLTDRIALETADTTDPKDPLRRQNPLGKIPALVLEDGTVLYDSSVIVEFLDDEAGGGVIIPKGAERFPALTLQSLADGMMDASVLRVYEGRYREPAMQNQRWLDHQTGKVERALAGLEAEPPWLKGRIAIGEIAIACALGYLDLRFAGTWRETRPQLVAWLDAFATRVPSFEATSPPR
jgi:glutathione S-transferase